MTSINVTELGEAYLIKLQPKGTENSDKGSLFIESFPAFHHKSYFLKFDPDGLLLDAQENLFE